VDLIVERRDGSVVALAVKLTAAVVDGDVRHLRWNAPGELLRFGQGLLECSHPGELLR